MRTKYFLYELKSHFSRIVVMSVFASAIVVINILSEIDRTSGYLRNSVLGLFLFVLIVLTLFIPIINFSFTKTRRSTDEFYSLPISKMNLIFVKGAVSVLEVVIPYTLSFFLGYILILLYGSELYNGYYLLFYLASLLVGISILFYMIFLYMQGNTLLDGLIIMGMGTLVFVATIGSILFILNINFEMIIFTPFYCYYHLSQLFSSLIETGTHHIGTIGTYSYVNNLIEPIISYSLTFLLGSGSVILLYFQTKKSKAEEAEDLSTSWFGYKTMIPMLMIGFLVSAFEGVVFIVHAFIIILAIIMTMIEHRSYKLSWKTWGRLGLYLLASIVISIVFYLFTYHQSM